MVFMKFFIRPSLVWRGGTELGMKRRKKHLVHVHQRIFLDTVFTRYESAPRPQVLLLVVPGHSPTVPETVLCEVPLHTHMESHDLEVHSEIPLVLVVLNSFQKKLHIVIRLLQMDWVGNGDAGVFIPQFLRFLIKKEHNIPNSTRLVALNACTHLRTCIHVNLKN